MTIVGRVRSRTGISPGIKLSATESNSATPMWLYSAESSRTEPVRSGWGPGGRRFKSCLPDTKGLQMALNVLRAHRAGSGPGSKLDARPGTGESCGRAESVEPATTRSPGPFDPRPVPPTMATLRPRSRAEASAQRAQFLAQHPGRYAGRSARSRGEENAPDRRRTPRPPPSPRRLHRSPPRDLARRHRRGLAGEGKSARRSLQIADVRMVDAGLPGMVGWAPARR